MSNNIAAIDKRSTPRIKPNAPVKISGSINANLINISDGGICFSVPTPVDIKKYDLVVEFPSAPIKISVQIRWSNKTGANGEFLYGASFIEPDSNILKIIRRYMISKHFKFVVRGIKDKGTRKSILKYAKNFRDYLFNLVDLTNAIIKKKGYQKNIQERLRLLNDGIVQKGETLKETINNKLVTKKIKNEFRSLVSCWAFKSQIMKRGFDKPRGYPGDSDTLEVIYDKKTFSPNNELGYYFDIYFLDNPYADAVRNRKDKLREILRRCLLSGDKELKILNLACGSSREIWELYTAKDININQRKAEFTLLDWDDNALEFSRNRLKNISKNIKLNFLKEDVMQFVKSTEFFDKHGKQDLIYSIGLADYLPDRVLKKMIKNSFVGLNPGGSFIIAHKDKEIAFSHLPPEWFCDWEFFSRNEKDMKDLVESAEIGKFSYNVEREKSGQIFFITITKQK